MALIDYIARNPTAGVSLGGVAERSGSHARAAARAAGLVSSTFTAATMTCRPF
jgi:hypothetical protein